MKEELNKTGKLQVSIDFPLNPIVKEIQTVSLFGVLVGWLDGEIKAKSADITLEMGKNSKYESSQQTVDRRQSIVDSRQQTVDDRWQTVEIRKQTEDSRQKTLDMKP